MKEFVESAVPIYGNRFNREPLVTFAIPAYNRPKLLAETLASIAAQTAFVDYEVIVCDDGGLPETQQVVERFSPARITYYKNDPPLGAVGNWNRCLRMARGRWVMVLHEDDVLYPWYMEMVLPRLHDGVAAVGVKTVQGVELPLLKRPMGRPGIRQYSPQYFLKSSMTPFPGVLIRRETALELGGFNEHSGPLADYDFWYRLSCVGRVDFIRAVGAFYRVAQGQWTDDEWPRMIQQTHLMRLRIVREQFKHMPKVGRWLARFFTYRNALAYGHRFPGRPASLVRASKFGRIPFARLPSGWVWAAMRLVA